VNALGISESNNWPSFAVRSHTEGFIRIDGNGMVNLLKERQIIMRVAVEPAALKRGTG
jgi:hypothetical protein